MPSCAVAKCNTYNQKTKGNSKISYHQFPKDIEFCKIWINFCKRPYTFNVTNARICSKHFNENSFKRDLKAELLGIQAKKVLKETAVPTENLPMSGKIMKATKPKTFKIIKPIQKNVVTELVDENIRYIKSEADPEISYINEDGVVIKSEYVNISECYSDDVENLKQKLQELQQQNEVLLNDNKELMNKIQMLTSENSPKNINMKIIKRCKDLLSKIFTPGQVKSIISNRTVKWSNEDIASAISLRNVSPKAYCYLREKLKYPLPGLTTLRRWREQI